MRTPMIPKTMDTILDFVSAYPGHARLHQLRPQKDHQELQQA